MEAPRLGNTPFPVKPQPVPVALRPAVRRFAELMEQRLQANEHKEPWKVLGMLKLIAGLSDSITALIQALDSRNYQTAVQQVGVRAADVANWALFFADNFGALDAQPDVTARGVEAT